MLDELRRKPKEVRERYAFLGALSFTGVVAMVWLVATFVQFNSVNPFSSFSDAQTAGAFSQFFDSIKNDVSKTWQQGSQDAEEGPIATTTSQNFASDLSTTTSTASSSGTSTASRREVLIATSSSQIE